MAMLVLAALAAWLGTIAAQFSLTPRYFNIAENRPIMANATCGEGVMVQEEYCKLVGGGFSSSGFGSSQSSNFKDGQVCDFCLPRGSDPAADQSKIHGAESAVDGDITTWWQSPPLSRGRKYNYVDLEINLLQSFQVAYVVVTMADSPRPGVWALEKSMDNGVTWTAWQYFASNDGECQRFFNMHARRSGDPIRADNEVTCTTEYSKVLPVEGGEIFVALTTGRPSQHNIQESEVMLDWLTATNVRLRLMQTKTMLGHLMSVAQGDNTVTRRYYYAIKEISIGGRCVCNGHAYICPSSPLNPDILQCECQHGTTGINCDECLDGYTQKAWRRYTRSDPFECEQCNCHGHTDKCHYNETVAALGLSMDIHGQYLGGGQCDECKDFTTGINCAGCVDGHFRPPGVLASDTTPCRPCDCKGDVRYSGSCAAEDGQCECTPPFRGAEDCTVCAQGYYGYPDCLECPCTTEGTRLDDTGIPVCVSEAPDGTTELQCPCKENFGGEFCQQCAEGYYNFPECTPCECHLDHAENDVCNLDDGQCSCLAQYGGRACEECTHGHFNYPDCATCACDAQGSEPEVCSKESGDCLCREGYGGDRCDRCATGWWGYPRCEQCQCSEDGAAVTAAVCDAVDGQCPCHVNYGGRQCGACNPGYYQYPTCFDCQCDRTGSVGRACSEAGVCTCNPGYVGEKCDQCAPNTYNYPLCEICNCNPNGVSENFFARGGCDTVAPGELCDCKAQVTGRICDSCRPLFWNLQQHTADGCEECGCFRNGTIGRMGVCDQLDGQCACKPAVGGDTNTDSARRCIECLPGFFELSANKLLGCSDCDCDLGGSEYRPGLDPACDVESGQCLCKPGMRGRRCSEVMPNHYTPLLYQFKYEIEDGYRADGATVVYDYKQAEFPGFSWKGYAGFSQVQDEVLQDFSLTKASTYNTVIRYQNPNLSPTIGTVSIYPLGEPESPEAQIHQVLLEPSPGGDPAFVTVSGEAGVYPSPFELDARQWTVSLKIENRESTSQPVLVDYLVLLPTKYVKPSVLRREVQAPCRRGAGQEFCRRYTSPPLDRFPSGMGREAMRPGSVTPGEFYDFLETGDSALPDLGLEKGDVVQLASWQPQVHWNVQHNPGQHVAILAYFTEQDKPTDGGLVTLAIKDMENNAVGEGEAFIMDCPYNSLCRQVVTDAEGRLLVFNLPGVESEVVVKKQEDTEGPINVERVVLVPLENWTPDFVQPSSVCVQGPAGDCLLMSTRFPTPDTSVIAIPSQILTKQPARKLPDGIHNKDTPLVYVTRYSPDHAESPGPVAAQGDYVFMVHYYQPDHPLLHLQVNISDLPTDTIMVPDFPVYEAVLPLPTCAATQGCRSAVLRQKGDTQPGSFRITEKFDIHFRNEGPDGAWIEYVTALPTADFTPELLVPDDSVDQADAFEQQCGQDNFYIPDTLDEGFCRAAVTSISADFNERALECECDADGSVHQDQCNSFGGQCQCKPHVIGQKCERCEPEYFGFPDCQPCACPTTATCNELTGECICAKFVTGTQDAPCSTCEANTYGYNAVSGCLECSCRVEGTEDGDMACSLQSGQCNCKARVEGRQCDHCQWGAWNYPDCDACDCETSGTTDKICNQETSECKCKENVEAGRCDTCKDKFFNLQAADPLGCMDCFCFGKSANCASNPALMQTQIVSMDGWSHVTFNFASRGARRSELIATAEAAYGAEIRADFRVLADLDVDLDTEVYYFQSSPAYGGSQIKSYGGRLAWNLTHWGTVSPESKKAPDVILQSRDSLLLYYSGKTALEGTPWSVEVPLEPVPGQWMMPSGNSVDRRTMMTVLNRLDHIYIKGAYGTDSDAQALLGPVALGSARQVQGGVAPELAAAAVETCECPLGYTGHSCQLCDQGYFSVREDNGGPICEPCQCNSHGATCHPTTGVCKQPTVKTLEILNRLTCVVGEVACDREEGDPSVDPSHPLRPDDKIYPTVDAFCHFNPSQCEIKIMDGWEDVGICADHTKGDTCELCVAGYYGDATRGGTDDCQACPCPTIEHNYAESCDALTNPLLPAEDQVCDCLPHYTGSHCQHCGPGYFGQPDQPGGECRPCTCNGNIDTADPEACHRESGLCQLCQGDTTGDQCQQCQDWFYGDAITEKNCEPCSCDMLGTTKCNHITGQCECKPGVEGEQCDRCQADYWGFTSGVGCTACECSDASVNGQCDQTTGQCVCKDGVRGQKCEICENGFWNLGPLGCEQCTCNADYAVGGGCVQETGQCTCLPYVDGINCDGCPLDHILIQNEVRVGPDLPAWKAPFAHEDGCFPCADCIKDLRVSLDKIRGELDPIMELFQNASAAYYADVRLNYITGQVDRLRPEINLLNPAVGNQKIQPLEEATTRLTALSKSLNLEYKLQKLKEWAEKAMDLEKDGGIAVHDMGRVMVDVNRVINDVEKIVDVLNTGMNADLMKTSLINAQAYLDQMLLQDFSGERMKAEEEQNLARGMMEKVKLMSLPVEEFQQNLEATEQRLDSLQEKIADIDAKSNNAKKLYLEANEINFRNKEPKASRKIDEIGMTAEATEASQSLGNILLADAERFLQEAEDSYNGLDSKKSKMEGQSANFEDRVTMYQDELDNNLFSLEREAATRAQELTDQAANIETISVKAQAPAQKAIQAATAFRTIIDEVAEARTAADAALEDSNKAADMSEGVAEKASKELNRINQLYNGEADEASRAVEGDLGPRLERGKADVESLKKQTTGIKQDLEGINDQLSTMVDLSNGIESTKILAGRSLNDANGALTSIDARHKQISAQTAVTNDVRNNNTAFDVAVTNIKKALNEYESQPNRGRRGDVPPDREKRQVSENDITDRLDRLTEKKKAIENLANSNSELVGSIQDYVNQARNLLGKMNKPAVTFATGSNLELNNPENLEELATKTDISFYVKGVGASNDSLEANDRAFMFYLGNLEGTSKKLPKVLSDDFMAIEVMKSGYAQLTMDLGSGPVTITSTKPLKANDWSQVVVRREGRHVELVVRTERGPGEQEEDTVDADFPLMDQDGNPHLSGSVFNLHQEHSRIYVGGFPTGSGVQNSVRSTDMTGQIEGLMIGGKEVGLWNYKAATLIEPSVETRNKFIPQKTSELRFEGDGYMKLKPEQYSLNTHENYVEFEFRATHPEGLMFLAGSPELGYLAIQLRDSRIVFSFQLGEAGGLVEIQSDPVELETWVRVRAEREGHSGTLLVDGSEVGQGVASAESKFVLASVTDLYFGGYPLSDYTDLQQGNFFGCIKNANIAPDSIDNTVINSDQVTLVNVELECEPPQPPMQSTVSFLEATPGHARLPPSDTNGSLTLTFMFRTTTTHGLITYLSDTDRFYYISLSMLDGALHLYAHPDIKIVTRNPKNQEALQFNDNKWHTVSITVLEEPRKMIFLQVDDFYEYKSGEVANVPLLFGTSYETFLGGIPDGMDMISGAAAHNGPFIGCIRDLVLLDQYVDWEAEASLTGAILGECSVQGVMVPDVTTEDPNVAAPPTPENDLGYDVAQLFPALRIGSDANIQGSCSLPVSPALDPELDLHSGFRFGVKSGSYIEYIKKKLPEMMVSQNRFQLDFKTSEPDGLMFFMVHEVGKTDFIALYMKGGKLVYSFNCGSGPSHLSTQIRVDDGKWHSVEFSRVAKHGKLVLDSIEVKVDAYNRESAGSTTNLEVRPNIYIGGVDTTIASSDDIKRELQMRGKDPIPGFIGCLRGLKYEVYRNGNTRMRALGTKWAKNNMVIPCSEKVESGYFFGTEGGRIRAEKRFRVGLDFDITMMIKPRNLTGILVAVRGRRDYLVLSMTDGAIQFTVDNGRGPITAVFKPSDKHEFCNGQWHEIHAVKAKNVVTLSVNKIFAQPGIGVPGVSSTDTNNPIFLGGHPRPGKFKISGDAVNYSGCMKEVVIEGKPVEMTADRIIGDIQSHVCSTI